MFEEMEDEYGFLDGRGSLAQLKRAKMEKVRSCSALWTVELCFVFKIRLLPARTWLPAENERRLYF